ncbi:MAG: hypothetical protein GY807_12855 [Gammaproteobacteria bacterium]|nr:hypothetical protein [Gammaproteobacteria bacterium]
MSVPRHPPEEPVILALDQGTHASRALLINPRGEVLFSHKLRVGLTRHGPNEVEQDPNEILISLNHVIGEARNFAKIHRLCIRSAGLSTQRSTVVAWHKVSGQVLYPALSWQDTRARQYLDRLEDEEQEIKVRTGLQISPHYGASKLRWLVEQVPEVSQAAKDGNLHLGPLASFLLFHLLEQRPFIIDHGNAARTLLWNISTRDWDPYLLKCFAIVARWLPRPLPIRADFGRLSDGGIPVTAVNGDQAAALYGHGALHADTVMVNIGTGAFVMIDTGKRVMAHPRLLSSITDSAINKCSYALEGTVNGAGSALQWAEQTWGLDISLSPQGQKPPLFINTVGGLGSPWWQAGPSPHLHGSGTQGCRSKPAECIAAILESTAFLIFANLQQILHHGFIIRQLSVSGGLSRYDMLCQALADLSTLPVIRSRQREATARGIAWQAGNQAKAFPAMSGQRFEPQLNPTLKRRYRRFIAILGESSG